MYEDKLEDWLSGYISWENNPRGETGNNLRMTREQYFKIYFPKDYDYMPQWNQLQKIKQELRLNNVIKNYCSDHNKYFDLNLKCPICRNN